MFTVSTSFPLTGPAARRTKLPGESSETGSPGGVQVMPRVARVVVADLAHHVTQRGENPGNEVSVPVSPDLSLNHE
jgi:hypothetical protein